MIEHVKCLGAVRASIERGGGFCGFSRGWYVTLSVQYWDIITFEIDKEEALRLMAYDAGLDEDGLCLNKMCRRCHSGTYEYCSAELANR